MKAALERLVRTLFSIHPNIDTDMVGLALTSVALATGAVVWLGFGVSLSWSLVITALMFVVLLLCLMNRFTAVVSMVLGVLAMSAAPVVLGMGLGIAIHEKYGAWPGGLAGLALGAIVAIPSFRKIIRMVAEPGHKPSASKPVIRRQSGYF